MNFSPNNKITIPDTTLFQELDGECVLLNLANESYYGLNQTGTRMWAVLAKSNSITNALSVLSEEYDIDEKTLSSDLYQFIDELLENQMVEIVVA
ncbi:MAG: PqqD family protein [Verrucomicrobiales bacterium]|nr:PqqD family protein [Verrucomicrobiales bacterium]